MSFLSIGSALILVYLAVHQNWRLAQKQTQAFGQTIAEQLASSIIEPVFTDDHLAIQLNLNQLTHKPVIVAAAVYDNNGGLLTVSSHTSVNQSSDLTLNALTEKRAKQQLERFVGRQFSYHLTHLPSGYYASPVIFNNVTAAHVIVVLNQTPMNLIYTTFSNQLIFAVIIISLLSLIGAYFLSRMLSKPINTLRLMSTAAGRGEVQSLPKFSGRRSLTAEWDEILSVYDLLGKEVKNKKEAEKLLQQFVDNDVAVSLLDEADSITADGEIVDASILFVDIVSFTSISEKLPPEETARLLNRYLSIFAACARTYKGTVDKFIGDAAMIVFGAPRKNNRHSQHAACCAMAIQTVARAINKERLNIGLEPIQLRIGVNSGKVRAGVIGSELRKEFTVVGDPVNLASRLCDMAGAGEIYVSHSLFRSLDQRDVDITDLGNLSIRGKEGEVAVYRLDNTRSSQDWVISNFIEDILSVYS